MAVIFAGGAAYYYEKWEKVDGAALMLLAGLLFAIVAHFRGKALRRKRKALKEAIIHYEEALTSAFS